MDSSSINTESDIGAEYLRELNAEVRATRECLENVPWEKEGWKPHEKSMNLGYLSLLVADIPRWIALSIEDSLIDFATYKHFQPKSTEELVANFNENVASARNSLAGVSDEILKETFELKNQGQLLFSMPKGANVSSSINHMVHHRGQLTVYLRLLDIAIPSIYGPSADSGGFGKL